MAEFEIVGTVVERGTQHGVQGLRVEAWDRDTKYHDMLGSTITDGAGRFQIRFTDQYFGDSAPDRLPDVFFRVFRDETLVLSTQDHPMENQPGPVIRVPLEIDPLVEPQAAADRVSTLTTMKAVTFFRTSDFRGVGREANDRVRSAGSLLGTMLANGFRQWDWQPIQASAVRKSDVVGQDTETAQARLAQRQIEVAAVEPFSPTLSRDSARLLTAMPARLQPGEKVVLYEQDGQVKYYARVTARPVATIDQHEVQRIGGELENVKGRVAQVDTLRTEVESLKATTEQERGTTAADLESVRTDLSDLAELKRTITAMQADLDQRNQTIANLQTELNNVKASQARIEQTDILQRVSSLESKVRTSGPGNNG